MDNNQNPNQIQSPNVGIQQPNLGTSNLPPGFKLENSPPPANVSMPADPSALPQGFELIEDKYGSAGQTAIATLEGVGRGVLGPVAPAIERGLGVDPEAIRGRAEASPIAHGVGEAAGLIGSMAIPFGQANVLMKAGKGAQALAGLAKVAEGAPVIHKVGSIAVAQAAEMAAYSMGDEAAKYILQDPDQTAETAIANIGLSTALGGGIGAGFGTISPLWKATVGPKFEKALTGIREHLDGGGKLRLPEEIEAAQKTLGIEISPATRAGMSGDPKATQVYNELRENQNKHIINDIQTLERGSSDSVSRSLGVGPEDVLAYDEAEIGQGLKNNFLKEYKAKYGPVSEQLAKRDAMAETMAVSDDAKLKLYGDMLEKGMKEVGTDSPFYPLYHEYGNRILAKNTLGELDKLATELRNSATTIGADNNKKQALNQIRGMLKDFQQEQVLAQGAVKGLDTLATRETANAGYKGFAEMSDKLMNHLGVGDFKGYKTLVDKLSEAGPEALLRKFSLKGDAELIPFLKTHFPETFEIVRQNELKRLLKPAILAAKGDNSINIQKLASIVEKGMAGEKSYIESILPPEAIAKIDAASKLLNALPKPTRGAEMSMLGKAYKTMPANAMAAIGWLMGDVTGGVSGYLFGALAQHLGKGAPDAMKLAMLKFLASEQPAQAAGFKAMADMVGNAYKGAQMVNKASNNVFKPVVRVLSEAQMPTTRQLDKIDRMVAGYEQNPNAVFQDAANKPNDMGYYLPAHQVAMAKSSANALAYLASLKPKPFKQGPLDRPIEPSQQEKARYNRALEVAQQPTIVLQRLKDGTILPSDVVDIKSMYPALYNQMIKQVSDSMINKKSDDEPIPYKTRLGLSLFLGQPVDSSMRPESILKAQPAAHSPEAAQQQEPQAPKGRSPSALKKTPKSAMTATQGAEASRQNRD